MQMTNVFIQLYCILNKHFLKQMDTKLSSLQPLDGKPPEKVKEKKSHANWISPSTNDSDDSDIENELVNNIKHHTISSISALKDMLQESDDDIDKNGSFFQQYFQSHSSTLPSRNVIISRRLSQCREEDEDEEKVPVSDLATISGSDKSLSESSSGSKTSVIDTITGPTHKFVITKTKQPSDGTKNNSKDSKNKKSSNATNKKPSDAAKALTNRRRYVQSNTVHFPTDSKRPSIYSMFNRAPHYDSKFFDSSLIEMKNHTSSASALDTGYNEDIWVRRTPADIKKVSKFSVQNIYA